MPPQAEESGRERGGKPNDQRPRFPRGGPSAAQVKQLRAKLLAMRARLERTGADLADQALKGSGQDFSVDHMADYGSDNYEQDFSLALLEGETALLNAIETALRRMDGRDDLPYGICEECAQDEDSWNTETGAPWIPIGRLRVVPYASLCVRHQEEREEA